MVLPVNPPVLPMLATLTPRIPDGDRLLFEPKWDGYRCIVFHNGKDVVPQSRASKPFTRRSSARTWTRGSRCGAR
jgi:ATP-dependent DNA ligase